jgi:hypothetical protein
MKRKNTLCATMTVDLEWMLPGQTLIVDGRSTLLSNLVTASDYQNLPRLRRKYDPHKLIFVPLERGEG